MLKNVKDDSINLPQKTAARMFNSRTRIPSKWSNCSRTT